MSGPMRSRLFSICWHDLPFFVHCKIYLFLVFVFVLFNAKKKMCVFFFFIAVFSFIVYRS
jgi:hypothetical protein